MLDRGTARPTMPKADAAENRILTFLRMRVLQKAPRRQSK